MSLPPRTPDLAVLDLLVSVAETGSLGKAAACQRISQPAASMRIRALERRLHLVLLERGPTGSQLTVAGASVVDWARPVLEAAGALMSGVAALDADQHDRLRVAASITVADHLIPGWLLTLHGRAPEITVALRVGNSQQVADLVRAGEVDLGFVESPRAPAGMRSRVVGGDELVVVVAPTHRWARRSKPVPLATLAATPLILREPGSGTRDSAWYYLGRAGEPAAPAAELGSTTAIKSAVTAGDAPAILSRLAVTAELRDGRLVAVPVEEPHLLRRDFRAVWLPGRTPSGPSRALLSLAARRPPRAATPSDR